jgi:MFS family permease
MPVPVPLRSATFRHLAAGYTINELGNWIADVALAILVYDRTRSPLATATLFLALRFAPALLAPLLTTRLEIFSARRILPAIYLAEALIFAVIALLSHHFWLPAILGLAALDGMFAIAASALTRGATSRTLGAGEQLRRGNAILNMGFTAGGAVGPALAGALIAVDGPAIALAIDAATFVVVAALLATAPELEPQTDHEGGALSRLRAGLREVSARPGLRRLLLGTAGVLLFGAAVIPIEVVFAKRTLHAGDTGYGLLLGAWGVGMVAGGGAFAGAARVPLSVVVATSTGLIAAGYTGLALAPTLAVACVFSAVGGAGNGLWWVAVVTATQQAISGPAQNAVMAVLASINQVMPAAGFLLGGIVTALGSPRTAYALSAMGVAVVLVATALRPVDDRACATIEGAT